MEINLKIYEKLYGDKIDSVGAQRKAQGMERNTRILQAAQECWNALDAFRKRAERVSMFVFGNQWGDKIKDPVSGKTITEEEHIRRQGLSPHKNNLMRNMNNAILGQYGQQKTEPIAIARLADGQKVGDMVTNAIQANYEYSNLYELDRRNLEYFISAGLAVYRTRYSYRDGASDCHTDIVNYHRFFCDSHMEDPRHKDCRLVGEIHDISTLQAVAMFGGGDREKIKRIKEIYRVQQDEVIATYGDSYDGKRLRDMNFLMPDEPSRCRVIEVWTKETKERLSCHDYLTGEDFVCEESLEASIIAENMRREAEQSAMGVKKLKLIDVTPIVDEYWYYRFLSPYGDVLQEGETPYWHRSHPYSFRFYNFYDGEVHPFIETAIDQNKNINKLTTMQMFILGASAKGVLMVPEDCVPDDMTPEEFAAQYVSYNGVIFYRPRPDKQMPQQIVTQQQVAGLYQLLQVQLEMIRDVSGIHPAMTGGGAPSGTAASLYYQQSQNAQTSLVDLFATFNQLRKERDFKIMQLIQQYYQDSRYMIVAGTKSPVEYNPALVRNVHLSLTMSDTPYTPALRLLMQETLMTFLQSQLIDIKTYLKHSGLPMADGLIQDIEATEQQMASQQQQMQQTQQIPQ